MPLNLLESYMIVQYKILDSEQNQLHQEYTQYVNLEKKSK